MPKSQNAADVVVIRVRRLFSTLIAYCVAIGNKILLIRYFVDTVVGQVKRSFGSCVLYKHSYKIFIGLMRYLLNT